MSAMVTDTVEVERRSGSSSFKTRPVSVAGDVVLRHTSVDIDRSAKTVTTGPSVGSGADLPPKPPTRAKKQPAPKPPAETAVADSKTKQLPLSSFAVDSTPLAINGVETKVRVMVTAILCNTERFLVGSFLECC